MSYKNIRKIKNFNEIQKENDDIYLLSNYNYLNLYNIYNIDDLYNFVNNLDIDARIAGNNKYDILYLIFDCWIINNVKILKKHNSYFIDLCELYLKMFDKILYEQIETNTKYSNLKKYISKFIKKWISNDIKIPLINNNFFLPELKIYLEKLYNI